MSADKPLLPQGPELLAPARPRLVALTLALAVLLSLLPWSSGIRWLVPDFVLMTLLYWHLRAPRLAGMGLAFGLGLLNDAAQGVLIGQHALVYAVVAYLAIHLHRRLEGFDLAGQTLQLAPILMGQQALLLLLGLLFDRQVVDAWYLAAGLAAALLWLPLALLLDILGDRPTRGLPREDRT